VLQAYSGKSPIRLGSERFLMGRCAKVSCLAVAVLWTAAANAGALHNSARQGDAAGLVRLLGLGASLEERDATGELR
jgi:hypothetical protein